MMWNNSYYGNFRQETFSEIFKDVDAFVSDYKNIGIKTTISSDSINTLYYLLYSKYGNSVISSSDITRFKYDLFGIIFSFGPTWEKKLDIQSKLRDLTEDELITGTTNINNQALNPGTAPSTQYIDELPAINQQVVSKYKKDKMSGYAMLMNLLDQNVTSDFLKKFDRLFLRIVQPEMPLWYETNINEE